MGIGGGIFLVAIGAILAFAVRANFSWLDVHVVGWILMLSGATSNNDCSRGRSPGCAESITDAARDWNSSARRARSSVVYDPLLAIRMKELHPEW